MYIHGQQSNYTQRKKILYVKKKKTIRKNKICVKKNKKKQNKHTKILHDVVCLIFNTNNLYIPM